jgi:hypothetical protein
MQARQDKNVGAGVYRQKESGMNETAVAIKRWRN